MKRFSFRLQPVLKYRTYLEQLAQQEMVKAFIEVAESEKKLKQLRLDFFKGADDLEKETVKGISAASFRQFNDFLDSLENDINGEEKNLTQLKQKADEKQRALTQKSVDRKIIERLKERKKNDYRGDVLHEEQTMADEVSSLKKAREEIDENF